MQTFYAGLQLNNDFRNLSKDSRSESFLVRFRFRAVAYFLACAVVTGAAVMTVLLVMLPRPARGAQRHRALLCVREECFLGGSVMSSALGLSRDPCDDFYAYVCGNWKPTSPGTRSAIDDVRVRTMSRAAFLLDQQHGNDFLGRAAKVYRSCLEVIHGNQDHTLKLRAFLQERGLFWPRPAPANATTDPLFVAVDLSINWRLDLWFHIALVVTPGEKTVHARLQPGMINQDWVRFLWLLRHDNQMTHLAYQQEASKLFTKDGFETMTREEMEQMASLEQQIAQMLSPGNMTLQPAQGALSKKRCGRVTWRNADCLMPGVQPSRWLAALSRFLGPSVNETTTVSVWNSRFGEMLGKVLSLNPNNVLLDVIGWTVVQMLGWAAHPLLGYVRLGGEVHSRLSAPPFCLAATEALLGEPATATLLATHLPARHRMQANSILSFVTKSFSQMMRASTSALSLGHEGDLDPTRNVTLRLWPKTVSRLQLERSYCSMPEPPSSSSFLDNWFILAPTVASLAKKEALAGGSPMGPFGFKPFAWRHRYEEGDAAVLLPIWIMFPPIYAPGLPHGVAYGGVGSLYATLLTEGLSTVFLDSLGKTGHYTSLTQCSHKQEPWFRRAIGIEATWRAFRRASSIESGGSGGHLLGLEDFSAAQMFFISACLQLCDAHLSRRTECNFALRQLDAFANVFSCAEGMRMNPRDKCRAW